MPSCWSCIWCGSCPIKSEVSEHILLWKREISNEDIGLEESKTRIINASGIAPRFSIPDLNTNKRLFRPKIDSPLLTNGKEMVQYPVNKSNSFSGAGTKSLPRENNGLAIAKFTGPLQGYWSSQRNSIESIADEEDSLPESPPQVFSSQNFSFRPFISTKELMEGNDDYVFGHLAFNMQYKNDCKSLSITIGKLVGLPYKGLHGSSYKSWINIETVPNTEGFNSRTKLSHCSLNPKFNQSFVFIIDLSKKKWKSKSIRFSVFEKDKKSIEDSIGHAILNFSALDYTLNDLCLYNLPLRSQLSAESHSGELLVRLFYDSVREKLMAVVERVRNLKINSDKKYGISSKNLRIHERVKIYVKVTLRNSGEKIKTMRSSIVKLSQDTTIGQTFSFVLPIAYLNDSSIVCSVMQQSLLKSYDILLGRRVEGPFLYTQNKDMTLWGRMLRTTAPVASWKKIYA